MGIVGWRRGWKGGSTVEDGDEADSINASSQGKERKKEGERLKRPETDLISDFL